MFDRRSFLTTLLSSAAGAFVVGSALFSKKAEAAAECEGDCSELATKYGGPPATKYGGPITPKYGVKPKYGIKPNPGGGAKKYGGPPKPPLKYGGPPKPPLKYGGPPKPPVATKYGGPTKK